MNKFTLFLIVLLTSISFGWTPEPEPSAFTLPVNQWTKVAEMPQDPYSRELEPGQGAYLCYFPDSGLFYRYGGYTPTENNDLYSFSLSKREWKMKLAPDYSWPPPSDRPGAGPWWSMAYDSKRKVIWMIGSSGTAVRTHPGLFNDIWKYDPATGNFTKMNSTGYYYSAEVRIVYDSINDRILRAPANDASFSVGNNRDKTWCYNPNTNAWEGRTTTGSPKNALAAVWVYAKDFGKAVYMSRGTGADSLKSQYAITWTYDYAANQWTQLSSVKNPPMRVCAAAAYDPKNKLVIIHGGIGRDTSVWTGYAERGNGSVLKDTWVLDLATGQWKALSVGSPSAALFNNMDGTLVTKRFAFLQAADFDIVNNTFVISSPYYGVWALRYQPGDPLPALNLPALPSLPQPIMTGDRIYPMSAPNQKLLDLPENRWVKLGGGSALGGGEVPMKYDATNGWFFKYGGCNNGGTTFASGYGNDLSAYDPATERWIAVRYVDPCGPARPANGCTRFYAHDPVGGYSYFAGGTAGNYLASSAPVGWTGGNNGIWRYNSKKDKFELIPTTGTYRGRIGVVCAYDQISRTFITCTQETWGERAVCGINTTTHAWADITTEQHAINYNYGDFADSIGKLLVMGRDDTLWALDPVQKKWNVESIAPGRAAGYPSVSYDCYNNVCLVYGINSKTYIYNVRTKVWTDMMPDSGTPTVSGMGEHIAFDRRHGVFIASVKGGSNTYAYKYKQAAISSSEVKKPSSDKAKMSISPNPFNPDCAVNVEIAEENNVRIEVYNSKGQMLSILADKKLAKGMHSFKISSNSLNMVAGVYLIKMKTKGETRSQKAVMVK
ncbi:MAG: T9SS type A sorting domain-containing protein [Fibrobacteres bacterium]|nr:T9SS type A sorting domain-containing protein [Fibrobacterota bacterium]